MLTDFDAQNRLLRINDVCQLLGLRSRQSVYNLVNTGDLPKPAKIGRARWASAWKAADIYSYIDRVSQSAGLKR